MWSIFWVTCICLGGAEGRRRNLPLRDAPALSGRDDQNPTLEIPCEQRTRCGNYSALPFYARNCFCDPACHAYDDCCRDYAESRDPDQGPPGAPGANLLRGITSCRRNEDIDTTYELYIVDTCPRRFQNALVRKRCENELAPEVFYRLPVTGSTSGVLYRNVYCAICAGDEDFVFWVLAYKCNGLEAVLGNATTVGTTIGTAEEFRRLITTLRCTLELLPPPGLTPRKCKSNTDKCDRKWKDERIARKCRSYTSYVYLDLETFRNKHCALCNDIKESSLTCEDQRTPYLELDRNLENLDLQNPIESAYLLYDINTGQAAVRGSRSSAESTGKAGKEDKAGILGVCEQGSVYDVLTGECRCTAGKCLELSTTTQTTLRGTENALAGSALVYEEPIARRKTKKTESQKATTMAFKTTATTTTAATTTRTGKATVATAKPTRKSKTSKHNVSPASSYSTNYRTPSSSTKATSASTRVLTSSIAATAVDTIATFGTWSSTVNYKTDTSNSSTSVRSEFVEFSYDAGTSPATTAAKSTTASTISSIETEQKPEIAGTVATVESSSLTSGSIVPSKTEILDTKYFGVLGNEKNSLRSTRYKTSSPKSSSRMTTATRRGKITPRAVAIVTLATSKGTTLLQLDSDGDVLSNGAESSGADSGIPSRQNCSDIVVMFRYDRIQSLTSFVLTLVSMVSLVVTFVTILLLPILQTMRGKILLGLTLCMFIGQLLYLLALPSNQPFAYQAVCYWSGCALHYFTLGGFFWISVLAFDTSLSIIGDRLDSASGNNCGRYIGYSLYAWLTPALIVIAGVIVDFLEADHLLIRPCYGEGVCFLTGRFALLLILALPAGVLTLISVFIYFLAASHACVEAHENKSDRSNGRTRGGKLLALSLSLTLLVALTWVGGFVTAFYGPELTWWIFVVLCPAQGIFICLAFICRRTVFNQLRNRSNNSRGSSASQWSYRKDFSAPTVDGSGRKQRSFGGSDTEIVAHETCM